jgi:hypothetical protein
LNGITSLPNFVKYLPSGSEFITGGQIQIQAHRLVISKPNFMFEKYAKNQSHNTLTEAQGGEDV